MADNTRISEIMTKEVVIMDANDPVREAEEMFGNHSLRHAPVLSGGELVGMLSLVDIQQKTQSPTEELVATIESMLVSHFMTPDPISVQESATVREVAALFVENEFHAIPVLDGERVVGIVSTTDIIRFFLEE